MDYETRISKIEAQQEMNQKEFDRQHQAIIELRKLMLERFDQVDFRFSEERTHTDLSIENLRTHTDRRLEEQRRYTEQGFTELRDELRVNMRWMIGMWFTTVGMFASLAGRVFGLY